MQKQKITDKNMIISELLCRQRGVSFDKVNLKLCAHGRQTKKTKRSRIPKPLYINNKQIDSKHDKLIKT